MIDFESIYLQKLVDFENQLDRQRAELDRLRAEVARLRAEVARLESALAEQRTNLRATEMLDNGP